MQEDERAAVAELCDRLPGLRAEISQHPEPVRELLVRLERAARTGEPIRALLDELVPVVEAGVHRNLEALPSLGPGRAGSERFRCPAGLCDRVANTEPAGPLPRCWLTGRFMTSRSGA